MPQLKNLRRIKDVSTGKYLRNVGCRGYSWRSDINFSIRNNAWDYQGTAYKTGRIPSVLKDAAQSYASYMYRQNHKAPKEPLPHPYTNEYWTSPKYLEWRESNQLYDAEAKAWIAENWLSLMPDTWVVEDFSLVLTPTDNIVRAKELVEAT